ncbi:Hypp9402 [Branchiostoma lanceolatum]|uniref:Hypp9402 protein n=1 Tax=Branchiostoma lanceolatum TaxID=7740 RepID=A0A8S4MM08_BRALA|nr:Hypp9402 [Branchiostoma lanceolatum]
MQLPVRTLSVPADCPARRLRRGVPVAPATASKPEGAASDVLATALLWDKARATAFSYCTRSLLRYRAGLLSCLPCRS